MKRMLVYFIYDGDGIVDDYIYYALEKLRKHVTYLLVVSNGKVQPEHKQKLETIVDYVLERKNIGFDVWAYKDSIDSVGWEGLAAYDELVLMNYTIMGPIYDLTDMFATMDAQDVDFWGITKCFREDAPSAVEMWKNPYGYIPEHIQSSFTAFRKSLFSSEVFQDLWNNMPMIETYYQSGGTYEQVITKKFSDLGYKWSCYTDYSSIDPELYGCCPLITAPLLVVRDLKSPFFKRRTFFTSKLEYPAAIPYVREFWDFLVNDSEFDTSLLLKNLIRGCNQRDIVESLCLMHVID